jgi:hypothetical protein
MRSGPRRPDASAGLMRSTSTQRLRVTRYVEETGSSAFAILIGVYPGEGVRRSAGRRFAGPIETIAQGVAQRVIDLVIEALDVNALIERINLNAVLARVELNDLLRRVDLNEVLDQVDLNQLIDRVDVNQVLDRVDVDRLVARLDMDKLIARVDINQIADRIDIESLVKNTDLGAIMVSSSTTLATEAVDLGRSHAVSLDDTLARWVSRIWRNHTERPGPPGLVTPPEEESS